MSGKGLERRQFLTAVGAAAAGLFLPRALAANAAAKSAAPNFVVILAEAHGWSSTSVQMDAGRSDSKNRLAQTPNIANLSAHGMRFTQAYAPSPRCLPTRASLLTGKTPAQLHMTFVTDENEGRNKVSSTAYRLSPPSCLLELPVSETTIAEMLKRSGYATAHFGKWHMGRMDPARHGFDESDGATSNRGPGGTEKPNPQEAYGITQRGVAFAKRQVHAGKPFYLQISHYSAFNPEEVSPAALSAFMTRTGVQDRRAAAVCAGMEEMDTTIGTLLTALEQLGVADNTYVIYTSDHGTQGRNENAPLAGGKGTLCEGGIRVPFIVRGPGIKANTVSPVVAVGQDLFPTIAELAKTAEPLPNGVEGGSLVPVLTHAGAGAVKRSREELVFHFPHYDHDAAGPGSAIILSDFKLIRYYETGALHLYDLSKDVSEQRDLAASIPDKAKELERRLDAYLTAVGAQMPTPNPNYIPGTAPDTTRPGKQRKNGDPPGRKQGQGKGGNGGGGRQKNRPLPSE